MDHATNLMEKQRDPARNPHGLWSLHWKMGWSTSILNFCYKSIAEVKGVVSLVPLLQVVCICYEHMPKPLPENPLGRTIPRPPTPHGLFALTAAN